MIRRPPRPTRNDSLFPYTPRCRSRVGPLGHHLQGRIAVAAKEGDAHERQAHRLGFGRDDRVEGVEIDQRMIPNRMTGKPCGKSRAEEHTSELQSLMRSSYAVFGLKKKKHASSHWTFDTDNRA